MLRGVAQLEVRVRVISTHVTADVFEHIWLERHVHVDSPNDQTNLPLHHVQHSRYKLRGSFSRRHDAEFSMVERCETYPERPSTFLRPLPRRMV